MDPRGHGARTAVGLACAGTTVAVLAVVMLSLPTPDWISATSTTAGAALVLIGATSFFDQAVLTWRSRELIVDADGVRLSQGRAAIPWSDIASVRTSALTMWTVRIGLKNGATLRATFRAHPEPDLLWWTTRRHAKRSGCVLLGPDSSAHVRRAVRDRPT